MDRHFPTRRLKMHISDKPWVSTKTKELIRKRQESFDPSRPPIWRSYRNQVQRSIVADKNDYYKNRVERHKKSNPAEWYRQIRVMTTNNKSQTLITPPPGVDPTNAKDVATSINNHFVSISSDIPHLIQQNFLLIYQLLKNFPRSTHGRFVQSYLRSAERKQVARMVYPQSSSENFRTNLVCP